ncbi:MAG: helix-turn-helix domain-containing protein [Armatimonadota bacterium]
MPRKSELNAEQRAQLVLRLLSKEDPAAQIARRAGISEQTLYRWREEFINAGRQALNGRGAEATPTKVLSRLQAELAERDQVIGELTIANRILKKLSGGSS